MSRSRAGSRRPSTRGGPSKRRGAKVTGRRDLARTWWSQEWIASLEERAIRNPNRLGRGRTYARRGAVEEMTITEGAVDALVAGSRPRPYRVVISIRVFTDDEWDAVIELIASQVGFQARFQAGEVPEELVAAASDIGIELFPLAGELTMACSCPDTALPCKHLAAVFYQVAGALDDDPFRILLLRGAEREVIDRRLREARASAASGVDSTRVGVEPALALYVGIVGDGDGASGETGRARRVVAEVSGDAGRSAAGSTTVPSTTTSLEDRVEHFMALGLPGRLLLADLEVAARRAARHLSDGDALTPVPCSLDWATAPESSSHVPAIIDAAERIAAWEHEEALATELGVALDWTDAHRRSIVAAWDAAGPQAIAVTEAVRTRAWNLDPRQADLAVELLSNAGVSVRRYGHWLTLTGQDRRLMAEPGRGGEWWWLLEPRARHWVATRRLHLDELPDLGAG